MTNGTEVSPEAAPVPADSTPAETGPPADAPGEGQGDATTPAAGGLPSYLEMFEDYLAGQDWIGPAETPLVFHLKRLCQQLDRDPLAPAAVSSAYLQAFSRLDRRRPGAQPAGDGLIPAGAQRSIFDEMD